MNHLSECISISFMLLTIHARLFQINEVVSAFLYEISNILKQHL